jgi:hypothetical protein
MLRSSLSPAALIFLYSTIIALAVACRENKQTVATAYKQQQSQPLPSQTTQPNATTSPVTATADVAAASAFELGLDKAASAYSISQSAQSVEDWKLVASQYQEAIALLKQIERPSPYFAMAQKNTRIPALAQTSATASFTRCFDCTTSKTTKSHSFYSHTEDDSQPFPTAPSYSTRKRNLFANTLRFTKQPTSISCPYNRSKTNSICGSN